jgi:hypothetical protein
MKQFRIIAPDLPGFGQSDLPNRDKLKFYYTFDNITRVIDRTAVRKGPPSLPPHLVPLKTLRPGTKESKKYDQIVRSIRAIGLIEAPVVAPDPKRAGQYFLLDGHVRIEALKDLGIVEVECLISIDDETYTFNKRVNRLVPVQEHRMIVKAVERGVPENQIAEALGLEVTSVRRRSRMLNSWSIHERKSQKADRR